MQTINEYNIPKRSRYYHSTMDSDMLEKGKEYNTLGDSYVVFFCTFDPFKQKRFKYSFHNRCDQDNTLLLNDGINTIIMYTKGSVETEGEVIRDDLKQLRRYCSQQQQ